MMSRWLALALAAAIAGVLGVIAATVWIGARVREDTVVAKPYEEGLRYDAERRARAALGLAVALAEPAPDAGAASIAFRLSDGAGQPVDFARVGVELSRPDTSRDALRADARGEGGGRWVADLAFPAAGAWDVRFDVVRGEDRVRLEKRVVVSPRCDLGAGPCTRPLPDGSDVTLELAPRPLRAMTDLAVRVELREPHRVGPLPAVVVSFSMPGMAMGRNEARLAPAGGGAFEGRAVLVRCASGRRDWTAEVRVERPGGPARSARFHLEARE
jgi:nitrogen fixation protein FixH